jgi:hypothetical protein
MYKIEESLLRGLEALLMPLFGIKCITKYLFKYTPRQGGSRHFLDQLETLSNSSINWMSYVAFRNSINYIYLISYINFI